MTVASDNNYDLTKVLSDNIDELIYILNETFDCEYLNEKTHLKNLGYSCVTKKFTEYVFFPDLKRAVDFLKKILKSGEAIEEFRILSNHNFKYYEVKGKRFYSDNKRVKIFLFSRDISKFKELEREWINKADKLKEMTESLPEIRFWKLLQTKGTKTAIQKTREMLDLVIDNIPQFIYWKDKNLKYLGCNQNFALINNINDPNLIIGKTDTELSWLKNNLEQVQYREKEVMKQNKNESIVESLKLLNENNAWFEINRIPLHDIEGKVIGILSTYNDISDRIVAEQKIKESEEKYRSILENIREGYFEVDLKGNITFFNNSFQKITGYSTGELIRKNYQELVDDKNKKILINLFNSVYKTETPLEHLQVEFFSKGNIKVNVESSVYLKKNSIGIKIGFYGLARDITEKFNLEQKLKQSEEKYRLISENAYDMISILNQDLKFEYANEKPWFLTLGYNIDEIIGNSVLNFVHPDDKKVAIKSMIQGLEKGEELLEVRIKHKEGHYRWIEVKGKAFLDKDKKIKGITIGRDITEKKEATLKLEKSEEELRKLNKQLEQIVLERTKELRESEEKFRSIAEQTSLGIAILQDGYVVYTNQALADITGFTSEEISKWSRNKFAQKIHPEDLPFVLEQLKRKLEGDINLRSHYTCRIITKTEEIKWIELHSKAIKYQEKIADFITFIDITDKKKAEEKLIESEEKYRHLYENSPYSIVLLNFNGEIIDINSTTPKLFGYNKEDLIGKNYHDLFDVYPDDTKEALREIPELLSRGKPMEPVVRPRITKIYNKESKSLWVESELSTIKSGEEYITQVIIQDITEKKMAEEKLKESERILKQQNIELKELDRLKTDFISIAAHELKTPLISIGGYVDLILMREKELKSEIKEDLERTLNNVRRLEGYINRLMDVMKIEARKMELELKEEIISNIIQKVITELHFQINQKNLKLELHIVQDLVVDIDSFRMLQVFLNLISNAVKYSNEGGLIEITALKDKDRFLFKVKDYGRGLSKGEMQKLFGKFVSLGRTSEKFSTFEKSSGLGLYIVKGIIEAHGGKIWVDSEGKNKGAEFSFFLPIKTN